MYIEPTTTECSAETLPLSFYWSLSYTNDAKLTGYGKCVANAVFAGFSGHDNSIYNIIPELKNVQV